MSISRDGWLGWTERVPGDRRKLNGGPNGLRGIAGHSAEGWESYLRAYNTDHAAYASRKASWMFSNLRSGVMLQHFPVSAQCWTSGAGWPNDHLWSVESEGVKGLPLNEAQTINMVRLINEQRALTGRNDVQRIGNRTSAPPGVLVLVEHSEATRWGAVPTSCPSGRYDWLEILLRVALKPEPPAQLMEGDDMAVIFGHPENAGDHLLVNGKLHWIPNAAIREDLLAAMNRVPGDTSSPPRMRSESWKWLTEVLSS